LLAIGLGIALLPQLVAVESQMAQYVGGILQQVVVSILAFAPILRWERAGQPSRRETATLGTAAAKAYQA
jgi:hypothetical protein